MLNNRILNLLAMKRERDIYATAQAVINARLGIKKTENRNEFKKGRKSGNVRDVR